MKISKLGTFIPKPIEYRDKKAHFTLMTLLEIDDTIKKFRKIMKNKIIIIA